MIELFQRTGPILHKKAITEDLEMNVNYYRTGLPLGNAEQLVGRGFGGLT